MRIRKTDTTKKTQPVQPTGPYIPMSRDAFNDLFDYLFREHYPLCDHTLRDTLWFLKDRDLDVEPIVAWLNQNGGHCDCEVRLNVLLNYI